MKNNQFDTKRLDGLPIDTVAQKLGLQLRKNKCNCFIHDEKTPSFSIYPQKNMWYCFGCGRGGGVIKLVEEYNKSDFKEACKWLSNAFGITNYHIKQPIIRKRAMILKKDDKYKVDSEIYKWFFDNLSVTENVRKFIKARKYPDSIIENYNLKGLDYCEFFFEKCKLKWGIERLIKCGLAKEKVNETTGEITYSFTWWTNTMFFPYYNSVGDIIYIQGRTLNPQFEKVYKYVNLAGIETSLFNLTILDTLNTGDNLVITEGATDCISCCLMGKSAVGVIGAHGFKKEYVELLKNFSIIVIPDNDKNKTGEKFADKICEEFKSIGKTINVYSLTGYKDISEYYIEKWNHGKID